MSCSHPCRVILLLDLDCFYAQCERVRLDLDLDTSLALLQWNSTLAVTYPARRLYDIQRGDSWDVVHTKSQGKCLALHLPLRTMNDTASSSSPEDESIDQAYERVYNLSAEQRDSIRTSELGVRRYNHEGKACLERYRIASSRIFSVVLETLALKLSKHNDNSNHNFVLERASIDELFLDVTEFCWNTICNDESSVMDHTVQVGADIVNMQDEDPQIRKALVMGCVVAQQIRASVFETLGFTLSAGISTSKLVAKLGASYGKPDGQAVIFPCAIPHVMEKTKIRKVRNLGGKVGKRVLALLPPEETTMGSIARLLSLPTLSQALGEDTGRMVFEACHWYSRGTRQTNSRSACQEHYSL